MFAFWVFLCLFSSLQPKRCSATADPQEYWVEYEPLPLDEHKNSAYSHVRNNDNEAQAKQEVPSAYWNLTSNAQAQVQGTAAGVPQVQQAPQTALVVPQAQTCAQNCWQVHCPQPCYQPQPGPRVCHRTLDLVLLLDSSYTIAEELWSKEKTLVRNLVDRLDIGPRASHVNTIAFSTDIKVTPWSQNTTDLKTNVADLDFINGWSRTDLALISARYQFPSSPRREGEAPKAVVVFYDGYTDGPSPPDRSLNWSSKAIAAADQLKQEGVQIFVVQLGDAPSEEMYGVVSSPDHLVREFEMEKLVGMLENISQPVCYDENEGGVTNPCPVPSCVYPYVCVVAVTPTCLAPTATSCATPGACTTTSTAVATSTAVLTATSTQTETKTTVTTLSTFHAQTEIKTEVTTETRTKTDTATKTHTETSTAEHTTTKTDTSTKTHYTTHTSTATETSTQVEKVTATVTTTDVNSVTRTHVTTDVSTAVVTSTHMATRYTTAVVITTSTGIDTSIHHLTTTSTALATSTRHHVTTETETSTLVTTKTGLAYVTSTAVALATSTTVKTDVSTLVLTDIKTTTSTVLNVARTTFTHTSTEIASSTHRTTVTDTATSTAVVTSTVLVASTRLLSTVKTHTATSTHVTTATSTDTLTSTAIVTSVMVTISTGVSQIVSWVTYTTTALVTMTTTAIASITTTSTDIATSTLVTTETKTDTATLTTTRTDIASKTVYTTKTRTDVQTSTAVVSLTTTSTSTYATTKIATSTATLTETSTGVTTNTYTKTDTLTAISTSITTLVTTSIHLATSTQLLTSTKTETKTNTDTSTATTTTTHTHHTTETQVSTVRTTTVDTLSSTHVTTATITATKTQTTLATSTTVTTETDTQTKMHVMTSVETRTDKVTSTAMETATVMSTKVVTTCSANCPSATPTTSLTMTPPMLTSTTPPPERPPPSPACGEPADVAIVVHTSDSVSDEDFTSLKDFVAKIAGQYEVSQLGTHIGLITYSSTPKVEFSLNDERFYNPETIDSTIKALKVSGSGTRTDLALELAYNKLFSAAGGSRDNKPNTLILVTDSRSDEGSKSFKDVVAPLLAKHVRVIVVGVGKFIDYKELLLIADGKINSVIVTETFNDLNKNMEKVTNIACVQEESTPPQPASEATCDVKYRKVGCYGDKPTARAMPDRLATSTPQYEAMGLANWLPKFVCDCARKAKDNNYFFFGVQDYGECWSGPEAGDTYDTYGASANCVDTTRGACVDASNTTCCGKENANYVYEIITEEPKPPTNTARITRTPPQIVYVTSGATARFVWEYVVDDREREFAEHSPKWWYYYESQRRVEIAYENKVKTWRWEISSNCPGNLKKRVSKDGMATLVISNVTSADMGTYGFSLELTSSDPLLSMVKLVVTEPPKPSPAPPPCKAVVDLAFLIDGSKSIEDAGKGNFKRCLDFVKRIALSFDISASGTHIGIVTFATDPTVELEFDQSFDNTSIATIIDNIRNPDALTFTGKALETVKKDLFEKSQRANVHRMLIVLTDGRSWDAVQEPAKQLKESGVTLYAVGVGQDYDLEQLKDIASNPDEDVFTAGFADLDTLVDKIRNKACNEALLPPPPPVNTARFTKMPDAVVYVTRGNTVKLVWEYTVDNREREFARYSPSWDFYNGQGQSSQIAYEDKENKWRWSVTSMTIPDRLQGRVSKEGQATLVIRDLTTEDNGVYGCSLVLMSGEPIVSKVEIFVTEPSVPITPAPVVAQFSLTPPKTVTVHEGETVKLKWDYTVTGDKNIVFSQYSPTWDIYDADGNGIELAHEDMYMGWYWSVSATCPWYLRDRISKEDDATLVISNAEITDSATYGCNLKLSSGKIITEKVQLIVQEKPKPNVRFTKVPERIVRLKSGQTVTLVWDYTYEGDKKDAFGPYSPTWNLYYGDGESVQLAYEEKSANWKWAVAYTCPEGLRARISKAEKAALVIANLTTADSGQYGCSLMLATGAPLVDRMQLIVEDPPPPPEPPIDAYFTLVPSEIIYRYASKNVEFEWEYAIVGEKDKAFASHSPSWDLYAVNNQRTQLIYEDKEEGWRSHVASTCPARLKNRVSIKGQATLVIADLTVQDTGTYGCSLLLVTGKRIDSTVKLVVTDAPAPTATPSPATSPPCRASVDLVFLIDGSSSIEQFGKGNFLFCLNFVKRMAQSFEISSSGTHVAVVLYYDSSKIVFNLNDYKTIDEVTGAVDKIKYPGGSTFTGAGLRMVKSEVFDKSGRSNVPHILIVMTDGESHDDVAEPSRVLREDNTIIYAVGEGYYFKLKQLNEMASEPKINHVFTADFGQMNTIVEDIKDKACSEISFPTQAPPKRPTAAPALPTVTETWATIIPISPTTAPCKVAVDLAFVLDGSTSINNADPGNFQLLKNFMINIVKSFKISSERTHVGLVLYSSFTQLKFNFDKYSDSASIVKAINTTDYPKGGTRTGEALKMAKSQLFGASMRSVPKVLIVLTDGRSSDKVEAPSKALKDEGVVIFAVGVGDQIDPSELNVMASDSKSDHVFKAKFKELDRLVDLIKRKACPDPEYNHYQITSQVDIAGSCPVKFTKVGCFNDDMKAPRPFPTMLFTDRDTESVLYSGTKFNAGQWNTYMPDVVCRCAVKAMSQENIVFSIQNFGECWSGAKSENTYKINGESDSCVSRDFKSCDVENNDLCVGNATKHFVYQIDFDEAKEVEACSSQYEVVGCYSDKHIANNRPFLTLLSTDVDPKSKVYSGIPVDKGNWNRYLPDAVCRCAQNAESSGFTHFGLQNYGECWSGYDADKTYDIDGESSECVGKNFKKPCNNNEVCVGDEATAESKTTGMYVYRLRKEANGMGIYRKRSSLAYQRYRLHGNRKIKREVARHGHKSHKLRGKRRRTNK